MNPSTLIDAVGVRSAPLHLWQGRNQVTTWSAEELRSAVGTWADKLHAIGVGQGRLVATSAPTSLQLVAAILGAWRIGAAVVVLPEASPEDAGALRRVNDALVDLQPRVLLVDEFVPSATPAGLLVLTGLSEGRAGAATPKPLLSLPDSPLISTDSLALVQLTSGSTGRARGVPITHRQLLSNCAATADRMDLTPNDHILSWLPFTHDMGFCGALAQALFSNVELTLLPTSVFASQPMKLLQALSQQRATLSPNPASSYSILARLGRRATREGIDLSALRFAWAGAEPVFAHTLRAFEQAMQPLGLRPMVVQPAYGMAEAVVAVSFGPAGRPWRRLCVSASALRQQGVVVLAEPTCEMPNDDVLELVSNGAPLAGIHVQVRDDTGQILSPGHHGTLWVKGHSIATRYVHGEESKRFVDGWYDTGDRGFLWDGEVYVTGRVKDIISRGGVKVGAHEIEATAETALLLRPGRVAAFAHLNHSLGREMLVLVVARRFDDDEPVLRRRVTEAVLRECSMAIDTLVFTAAAPLPRTTSGKLQRGMVRELWLCGAYDDTNASPVGSTSPSGIVPFPATIPTSTDDVGIEHTGTMS